MQLMKNFELGEIIKFEWRRLGPMDTWQPRIGPWWHVCGVGTSHMSSGLGSLICSLGVLWWVPLFQVVDNGLSLWIPYWHAHLSSISPRVHCNAIGQCEMSAPQGAFPMARHSSCLRENKWFFSNHKLLSHSLDDGFPYAFLQCNATQNLTHVQR